MQQTPPTPESEEMMGRMTGNFDLFIAHEIRPIVGYLSDVDALRNAPTRIVSAAGETSGEQAARRAAIALAERLGVAVPYLPGGHGGWGSDQREFAERLHGLRCDFTPPDLHAAHPGNQGTANTNPSAI